MTVQLLWFIPEGMINTDLFLQEGLANMKKQRTENIVTYHAHNLPIDTKTNWKRIKAMSDKELESNAQSDKDTLFADEQFWKTAKLVMPAEKGKERITIRVDADILNWLKEQGRGYQSRINALLRTCMIAMKSHYKAR